MSCWNLSKLLPTIRVLALPFSGDFTGWFERRDRLYLPVTDLSAFRLST